MKLAEKSTKKACILQKNALELINRVVEIRKCSRFEAFESRISTRRFETKFFESLNRTDASRFEGSNPNMGSKFEIRFEISD